ncbi:MAG: HD domain-containing protein, partial [Elusimicrobia bacterium]|nr:HD domain-containing protein [Elusimicrobiota bacterium]
AEAQGRAAPEGPAPDTAQPMGALAAVDRMLSKPGAADRAAADHTFFRRAAEAVTARTADWRSSPDDLAARARGGVANYARAQDEVSSALLKAGREWAARNGLAPDALISNGTTLDALLGIALTGRIEATNPHRGFSGESSQVWGGQGLEGGASYGAKRAVGRDQPGVLLIIDNPADPIRVVYGETLSRAPTVAEDIKAAVVSDGRTTVVIDGASLRALGASAERWRDVVNSAARRGDMSELAAYERLQGRLSPDAASRPDGGRASSDVGAGAEAPLGDYFSPSEFKALHPKNEDVYHDWRHSTNVADMAYGFARARGLSDADAAFVREVALLHDVDPSRAPGTPARVPATLEALERDFRGEVSLTGEKGRSVLRERFGWDARKLAVAEAMIQRTEFPFADAHPSPAYKDASPAARYEAMLKAMPEGDAAFALREGALLSEYADKASWYATEPFAGALKVVEGLANEINAATGGKAQMTAAKLDSASFLKVIGEPDSFALDARVAKDLGMEMPSLPDRARAFKLLGGEYGARFEANVAGFEAYGRALKEGAAPERALEAAQGAADGAFDGLLRRSKADVGAARETFGRRPAPEAPAGPDA